MPLVEHLRELRNRLAKALLAIVVVTIVAAFFYNEIINFFTKPVLESVGCDVGFAELAKQEAAPVRADHDQRPARAVHPRAEGLPDGRRRPVVAGLALPALGVHRPGPAQAREEVRARASSARASRSSSAGGYFAYKVLPTTAKVLIDFTPAGIDNLLPLDDLLDLVTRMVVVFGLSFELPLLLVMLNLAGVITGKRMLGWWRGMIMGITVFAAVATPSTDPLTMLALAVPIWVLYFGAVGVLAPQRPPQGGAGSRRGTGRRRGLRPGPHARRTSARSSRWRRPRRCRSRRAETATRSAAASTTSPDEAGGPGLLTRLGAGRGGARVRPRDRRRGRLPGSLPLHRVCLPGLPG